jgi:cytochrome c biogenesis protein CcmG/thiol:disulfide interchange protein DsbE
MKYIVIGLKITTFNFWQLPLMMPRGLTKVPAMIQSKGWEFTVLADSKQELMQMLNFQTIPQTFLLDKEGNIVYTHSGYNPGDELKLEEEIKKLK